MDPYLNDKIKKGRLIKFWSNGGKVDLLLMNSCKGGNTLFPELLN